MKFTSPLSVVVVATATIMLAVTNTVEAVPDCVLTATDGYSICDDVSKGLFCKSDSDCQQVSEQKTTEEQQVSQPFVPKKKDDTTVSASNEAASAASTFTISSMMMSTTAAVVVAAGTVMLL
mmetsp:Transcript_9634/g.10802  ORF Transcript_9634/g.10802 Transcript_9634/m.10802 type:complete len:122 (+) Transcript_9634:105-470(+)